MFPQNDIRTAVDVFTDTPVMEMQEMQILHFDILIPCSQIRISDKTSAKSVTILCYVRASIQG